MDAVTAKSEIHSGRPRHRLILDPDKPLPWSNRTSPSPNSPARASAGGRGGSWPRWKLPSHERCSPRPWPRMKPAYRRNRPNCSALARTVSAKLDVLAAEFFLRRYVYGTRACKCCLAIRYEPAEQDAHRTSACGHHVRTPDPLALVLVGSQAPGVSRASALA